jgi:hypothetical protein
VRAATGILWLGLVLFHVPALWRLGLFVPAFFAATGFLQGFMHLSAGFGMRGVFNFGPQVGKTEEVASRISKERQAEGSANSRLLSLDRNSCGDSGLPLAALN